MEDDKKAGKEGISVKIVFWSPTPFAGRKSTNLLLMSFLSAEEGKEQLVIHADECGSGPEHFLLSGKDRHRMMQQREFGLELLDRMLQCERFDKSLVINSSYSFANRCLHLLPAGDNGYFRREGKHAVEVLEAVSCRAEKDFHTVWIEAPAGNSELAEAVCRMADLVVINLAQSPWELSRIGEIPKYKKELFLVGAYENRSAYSGHNISLMYPRMKGKLAVIPYQREILVSCFHGKTEEYLTANRRERNRDNSGYFFREVFNALGLMNKVREEPDAV